jgi:hypothetical protein
MKTLIDDPWDEAAQKYVWVPNRPGSRVASPEVSGSDDDFSPNLSL